MCNPTGVPEDTARCSGDNFGESTAVAIYGSPAVTINYFLCISQIKYIRSGAKLSNVFLRLFIRLNSNEMAVTLCPPLVECLAIEDDCFRIWRMNFKKHSIENNFLLAYMAKNWKSLPGQIRGTAAFAEFLQEEGVKCQNMSPGRHDNELNETIEWIKVSAFDFQILRVNFATKAKKLWPP